MSNSDEKKAILPRVAGIAGILLLIGFGFLLEARLEILRLTRTLPETQTLLDYGLAEAAAGTGPVAIRYVQSGKQARETGGFSTTGGFVLEWPDGRLFAVDLGMSKPAMIEFGSFLETAMDAGPVEEFGSLGALLGQDAKRIEALAFTHLHVDHTEGAAELCSMLSGARIPVYQTEDQFEYENYTTSSGREDLEESGCLDAVTLSGDRPLLPIPGYPGIAAFAIGGHTPGSTAFVARIGEALFVLVGDVTNVHSNLMNNVPKGLLYSYLIVPEATGRLYDLRRWFAALHAPPQVEVVVSHDLDAIVASGIPVVPADSGPR